MTVLLPTPITPPKSLVPPVPELWEDSTLLSLVMPLLPAATEVSAFSSKIQHLPVSLPSSTSEPLHCSPPTLHPFLSIFRPYAFYLFMIDLAVTEEEIALCLSSHDYGSTTTEWEPFNMKCCPLSHLKSSLPLDLLLFLDVNNLDFAFLDWHSPVVSEPLHFHTQNISILVFWGWSCKHKFD